MSKERMTVWVAGGLGFIGNHLCRALIRQGCRVIAIDNLTTSVCSPGDIHSALEFRAWDVTEPLEVMRLPHPDLVYHLASPATPTEYYRRPLATMQANTTGTINLLKAAPGARFIFASSSEVYGDGQPLGSPESGPLLADPTSNRAPYAISKLMGEVIVRESLNREARSVRLFNVYGPGCSPNDTRVIPAFIRAALNGLPLAIHGDGKQVRSFLYVDDAVEMLLALGAAHWDDNWRVLNVGNPTEPVSVLDLAKHIIALTRSRSELVFQEGREADPKLRIPDVSRLGRLYGHGFFVNFTLGLERTIYELNGGSAV